MAKTSGKIFLFVGRRKSGKTFHQKKLAKAIGLPTIITDIHGSWGVPYITPDEWFSMVMESEDVIGVADDTTALLPRGRMTSDFRKLCATSREKGRTLFFSFHGLTLIPDELFSMGIDGLFLLKSADKPDKVQKKFEHYPAIVSAFMQQFNNKAEFPAPIFIKGDNL